MNKTVPNSTPPKHGFQSAFPGLRLLVAGWGPEEVRLREQARRSGVSGRIEFLGPVAHADLVWLYRQAAVAVLKQANLQPELFLRLLG